MFQISHQTCQRPFVVQTVVEVFENSAGGNETEVGLPLFALLGAKQFDGLKMTGVGHVRPATHVVLHS